MLKQALNQKLVSWRREVKYKKHLENRYINNGRYDAASKVQSERLILEKLINEIIYLIEQNEKY